MTTATPKPLWVFKQTVPIENDYEILEKIGGGAYGKVFRCRHRHSGEIRAVKTVLKFMFRDELSLFRHEIDIMKDLEHENVIKFYGFYETPYVLSIVMELCEGGELFDYMRLKFAPRGWVHFHCPCLLKCCCLVHSTAYSEADASMWLRQVCKGLEYLHSRRIVHADIKPHNIMFKKKGPDSSVKIIDFGLASVVKKKHLIRGQDGTPEYMAPEVVHGKYSFHSDMWSFGVLTFTMLFGFSPFWTQSVYETYHLICDNGFKGEGKPTPGYENAFPSYLSCSDSAKDFITKLLHKDPVRRLSATEALEHPWLKGTTASRSPLMSPVMAHIAQTHDRTKLQKLVLEMIVEHLTDEDLEEWKKSVPYIARSAGKVTFQNLNNLVLRRKKVENDTVVDVVPIDQLSPTAGTGFESPMARMTRHCGSGSGHATGEPGSTGKEISPDLQSHLSYSLASLTQSGNGNGTSLASGPGAPARSGGNGTGPRDRTVINLKDLLMATIEHKLLAKEERVWSAFDHLDVDGNGLLTAPELAKMLHIPLKEARQIVASADKDGDGTIDLDEFVDHLMGNEGDAEGKIHSHHHDEDGTCQGDKPRHPSVSSTASGPVLVDNPNEPGVLPNKPRHARKVSQRRSPIAAANTPNNGTGTGTGSYTFNVVAQVAGDVNSGAEGGTTPATTTVISVGSKSKERSKKKTQLAKQQDGVEGQERDDEDDDETGTSSVSNGPRSHSGAFSGDIMLETAAAADGRASGKQPNPFDAPPGASAGAGADAAASADAGKAKVSAQVLASANNAPTVTKETSYGKSSAAEGSSPDLSTAKGRRAADSVVDVDGNRRGHDHGETNSEADYAAWANQNTGLFTPNTEGNSAGPLQLYAPPEGPLDQQPTNHTQTKTDLHLARAGKIAGGGDVDSANKSPITASVVTAARNALLNLPNEPAESKTAPPPSPLSVFTKAMSLTLQVPGSTPGTTLRTVPSSVASNMSRVLPVVAEDPFSAEKQRHEMWQSGIFEKVVQALDAKNRAMDDSIGTGAPGGGNGKRPSNAAAVAANRDAYSRTGGSSFAADPSIAESNLSFNGAEPDMLLRMDGLIKDKVVDRQAVRAALAQQQLTSPTLGKRRLASPSLNN